MKPCIVDMFQCSYFVGEAEVGKEGALCTFAYKLWLYLKFTKFMLQHLASHEYADNLLILFARSESFEPPILGDGISQNSCAECLD